MEKAIQSLQDELSRAASDILNASHHLQKEFAVVSEKSTTARKKPVPDPVKLIRRICVLERAIADLTTECEKIAQRRGEIAPAVIEAQNSNVALLRELSNHIPEELNDEKDGADPNEWEVLVDKLHEQATFFVPQQDSA